MSKSAIFDKAMNYIDEHIEQSKQEIKEDLYEYLSYSSDFDFYYDINGIINSRPVYNK